MGFLDSVKSFMSISPDDFEDETLETTETNRGNVNYFEEQPKKKEPRIFVPDRKAKANAQINPQMQVVLVRPDRFDDVTAIADHLNLQKSVVLNLEAANRETSRRIIDFLSGVAYANGGSIRKVANSTFMIVPGAVDVLGETFLDDFSENSLY